MRTILAMLGGAALGAGAALLFAPQSGRATRAFLRDKATKYGHDVTDFVDSKSRHLQNKMKGYRHEANKLMDRGEELINEGREKMESLTAHGGEMISRGQDAINKMKSSVQSTGSENPQGI